MNFVDYSSGRLRYKGFLHNVENSSRCFRFTTQYCGHVESAGPRRCNFTKSLLIHRRPSCQHWRSRRRSAGHRHMAHGRSC